MFGFRKKKKLWITYYEAVDEIIKVIAELNPDMEDVDLKWIREGLMKDADVMGNCLYEKSEIRKQLIRNLMEHAEE